MKTEAKGLLEQVTAIDAKISETIDLPPQVRDMMDANEMKSVDTVKAQLDTIKSLRLRSADPDWVPTGHDLAQLRHIVETATATLNGTPPPVIPDAPEPPQAPQAMQLADDPSLPPLGLSQIKLLKDNATMPLAGLVDLLRAKSPALTEGLTDDALIRQIARSGEYKQPQGFSRAAATERLTLEIAELKGQLPLADLVEGKGAEMRAKIEHLEARLAVLQEAPLSEHTIASLTRREDTVEGFLQRLAAPELKEEVKQLETQYNRVMKTIADLEYSLGPDVELKSSDVAAMQKEVEPLAAPIRDQIRDLQAQARELKLPENPSPQQVEEFNTARSKIIAKIGAAEEKLAEVMKPVDTAVKINMMLSRVTDAISLAESLGNAQTALSHANRITNLTNEIRDMQEDLDISIQFLNDADGGSEIDQDRVSELADKLEAAQEELAKLQEHAPHGSMQYGKIKKAFLEDSRLEVFMKTMLESRTKWVEQATKDILHEWGLDGKATIISVGSTGWTSDEDYTVASSIPGLDTKLIDALNERGREKFGVELGSARDVNLYTYGVNPDILGELKAGGPKQWESADAEANHNRGQEIAALVKQRKYMTGDGEWSTYVDTMMKSTAVKAMSPEKQAALRDLYTQADAAFGIAETKLHARMEQVREQHPTMSHYDVELTAMNLLYVEAHAEADKLIAESKNPELSGTDKELAWARATAKISLAHLFANEPYYSEGPVRHVVANEQAIPNKLMPKVLEMGIDKAHAKISVNTSQALQSLSENFGDCLKEINHLSHEGKEMGEIAIKASKYIGRLCRAIDQAVPPPQPPEIADLISKLRAAEGPLLQARRDGGIPGPDQSPAARNAFAARVLADAGLTVNSTADLRSTFSNLVMQSTIAARTAG